MASGRKIVIPVDGSKHSERAFDWYKKAIHRDSDEVLVVHAFDPYAAPPTPYPYGFAFPEDFEQHLKKTQDEAKEVLEFFEKKCKASNMKCTMLTKSGDPGESVVEVAKDKNANQIIMGSRGLGTVRRTLVGSVSEFCLHHTHIPVTIVPPDQSQGLGYVNKGNK